MSILPKKFKPTQERMASWESLTAVAPNPYARPGESSDEETVDVTSSDVVFSLFLADFPAGARGLAEVGESGRMALITCLAAFGRMENVSIFVQPLPKDASRTPTFPGNLAAIVVHWVARDRSNMKHFQEALRFHVHLNAAFHVLYCESKSFTKNLETFEAMIRKKYTPSEEMGLKIRTTTRLSEAQMSSYSTRIQQMSFMDTDRTMPKDLFEGRSGMYWVSSFADLRAVLHPNDDALTHVRERLGGDLVMNATGITPAHLCPVYDWGLYCAEADVDPSCHDWPFFCASVGQPPAYIMPVNGMSVLDYSFPWAVGAFAHVVEEKIETLRETRLAREPWVTTTAERAKADAEDPQPTFEERFGARAKILDVFDTARKNLERCQQVRTAGLDPTPFRDAATGDAINGLETVFARKEAPPSSQACYQHFCGMVIKTDDVPLTPHSSIGLFVDFLISRMVTAWGAADCMRDAAVKILTTLMVAVPYTCVTMLATALPKHSISSGDAGKSKSYQLGILEDLMIPGTVEKTSLAASSDLSITTRVILWVTELIHEMPMTVFQTDKDSGRGQSVYRESLTDAGLGIEVHTLSIQNGKKMDSKTAFLCRKIVMAATNGTVDPKNPTASRFDCRTKGATGSKSRKNFILAQDQITREVLEEKAEFTQIYRALQALCMLINHLIEACLLPEVSTEALVVMYTRGFEFLDREGYQLSGGHCRDMYRTEARGLVVIKMALRLLTEGFCDGTQTLVSLRERLLRNLDWFYLTEDDAAWVWSCLVYERTLALYDTEMVTWLLEGHLGYKRGSGRSFKTHPQNPSYVEVFNDRQGGSFEAIAANMASQIGQYPPKAYEKLLRTQTRIAAPGALVPGFPKWKPLNLAQGGAGGNNDMGLTYEGQPVFYSADFGGVDLAGNPLANKQVMTSHFVDGLIDPNTGALEKGNRCLEHVSGKAQAFRQAKDTPDYLAALQHDADNGCFGILVPKSPPKMMIVAGGSVYVSVSHTDAPRDLAARSVAHCLEYDGTVPRTVPLGFTPVDAPGMSASVTLRRKPGVTLVVSEGEQIPIVFKGKRRRTSYRFNRSSPFSEHLIRTSEGVSDLMLLKPARVVTEMEDLEL